MRHLTIRCLENGMIIFLGCRTKKTATKKVLREYTLKVTRNGILKG